MKYSLLAILYSIISSGQSYSFIPVDEEILEFVEEVNYTLFVNKKSIYSGISSKDTITILPNVIFDSISFKKQNYKETGLKKSDLKDVVLLSKEVYELNEVVLINSKKQEYIIGEKSIFVKWQSKPFNSDTNFGILFKESELKNSFLKYLVFFVEKVKHKTNYKIKFYSAEEKGNPFTSQILQLKELVFESPILTLEKRTKNKVEVDFEKYEIDLTGKNIFISIELNTYLDKNGNKIEPNLKDKTKLKFQLSKKTNYYSKMVDFYTKDLTNELRNVNVMVNFDFAFNHFGKPHKSNLVAPAILLNTKIKK